MVVDVFNVQLGYYFKASLHHNYSVIAVGAQLTSIFWCFNMLLVSKATDLAASTTPTTDNGQ